jgi:mRNA-degrading endonuclease toxin of MazEF toxin-antitoxin module
VGDFAAGDVVLVRFPFSDLSQTSVCSAVGAARPATTVSSAPPTRSAAVVTSCAAARNARTTAKLDNLSSCQPEDGEGGMSPG